MDPVTTAPPPSTAAFSSYPDSIDSSPHSRGASDSWDEPFTSTTSLKLRLMCSYGGRIVPRPTDRSLCYLGGDTRIVAIDRHSSLSDLHSKLSRSLLNNSSFTLKYQLPNEDLDSLISVTTDEDLENMVEEYDRIIAQNGKASRIRLFLFPTKTESSAPSSIGSLLDDSKSETWFVDALNGAISGIDGRGSTDSASVNCLLGLEDDSSLHSRGAVAGLVSNNNNSNSNLAGKVGRQDVQSVPDSPMMETNSSFGSASSVPSLSNLPPIADDRPPDSRFIRNNNSNIEEQFQQQLNLNPSSLTNASVAVPVVSPTERLNLDTGFGYDDDEKSDARRHAMFQQKVVPVEAAQITDPRPVYYNEMIPQATQLNPEPKLPIPAYEANFQVQQLRAQPISYPQQQHHPQQQQQLQQQQQQQHIQQHIQQQQQQQLRHQQLLTQQQQQPQQQYIQANPQYVQMPSYYQVQHLQQSQDFDPSVPMYYMPVQQNPQSVAPKPEMQPNMYQNAGAPSQMIHMTNPAANQGHPAYAQGMGYHVMHHQHPSQTASYAYTNVSGVDTAAHQAQVYYTQNTAPPSMPAQYQTVMSEAAPHHTVEVKQNRTS